MSSVESDMKGMLQISAAATLAVALVACGGGSGGNGNLGTSPAANFNLQAGIANMVAKGLSANVTLTGSVMANGTANAFTGTGTYSLAAGTSATFNGSAATAQVETLTGTVSFSGTSSQVSTTVTNYYSTSASSFVGQTEGSSEYDVAQAPFEWPTSVVGGSGGPLGTVLRYSDSTMSVSIGKASVSYSVASGTDASSPIQITVTTQIFDAQNNPIETDTTTYSMTSANVITFAGETANQNSGNTLTVKPQ
jgi:hypothetical protein